MPVIAWGLGVDRLFMMQAGIEDIRSIFSQDLGLAQEETGDLKCRQLMWNMQNLNACSDVNLHGDMAKLDEVLAYVKGEVKLYDEKEGIVSIEMKDTNRPDLWSVEGLARGLQGYPEQEKGIKGVFRWQIRSLTSTLTRDLANIRPFIGCCIIKNVHLTDDDHPRHHAPAGQA